MNVEDDKTQERKVANSDDYSGMMVAMMKENMWENVRKMMAVARVLGKN